MVKEYLERSNVTMEIQKMVMDVVVSAKKKEITYVGEEV
jgi:hypothetical protein